MGKKYLETKKDSLEASVLNVWQKAVEQTQEITDNAQMLKNPEENTQKEEVELDEVAGTFVIVANGISDLKKADARYLKDTQYSIAAGLGEDGVELDEEGVSYKGNSIMIPSDNEDMRMVQSWAKNQTKLASNTVKMITKNMDYNDLYEERADHLYVAALLTNTAKPNRAPKYSVKFMKEEVDLDEARQLKDPKKEVMVVKGNKVVVIDKKDQKKYLQKGYKLAEASGDKEAYTKFFNSALKKFKVNSPAELKGDAKKKFYDYVDKNWEGDNEKAEAAMAQVREFKIQGMKAALASIWNVKEGKNPFKVEDDKKVKSKDEKTMTGKKAAIIDLKPKIKD